MTKDRLPHTLAILRATKARFALHWVDNTALSTPEAGGLRFGGRIFDLRKLGHVIIQRPDPADFTHVFYSWLGVKHESKADTGQYALAWPGTSRTDAKTGKVYVKWHTSDTHTIWTRTTQGEGGSPRFVAIDPPHDLLTP